MKNALNMLAEQLFEPDRKQTRGEILFFRFFEFFILVSVIQLSWTWGWYTLRNSEIVLPLGLANYLDISFMFNYPWPLVNAAIISGIGAFSFFKKGYKWQYLLVLLLFHLQYVARFSQGEIPHSANLAGMCLMGIALGMFFFEDGKKQRRFSLGCIFFFIGLGYTTAGFSKLIGTGFNWADGRHLWLWMAEKGTDILSRSGAFELNLLQQLAAYSIPAATVILLVGWLTEFAGFLFWFKKLRPYITTALIGMHFGITLTMNIRFDSFVMILILLGYPWDVWIDRLYNYFSTRNITRRVVN